MNSLSKTTEQVKLDGFAILPSVVLVQQCAEIAKSMSELFTSGDAIFAKRGRVVGGRNLLTHWSGWPEIVDVPVMQNLVEELLGKSACVVRILYFDKPPGEGWSLAMHKDRTIAVKQHFDPPAPFAKPTKKAGVPHVEATEELLGRMLTLRLHLDAMHDDNGPLVVVPRSHAGESDLPIETIHCDAGDVFVRVHIAVWFVSRGGRVGSGSVGWGGELGEKVRQPVLVADEIAAKGQHAVAS